MSSTLLAPRPSRPRELPFVTPARLLPATTRAGLVQESAVGACPVSVPEHDCPYCWGPETD